MTTITNHDNKPVFNNFELAFDLCREKNKPVEAWVLDKGEAAIPGIQGLFRLHKLYPSGREEGRGESVVLVVPE